MKTIYPSIINEIWVQENCTDTKRIIFICRENLFKLLKLKKFEDKSRKILAAVKIPEKIQITNNFSQCRLPVEGKSMKLQSPSSGSRPRLPVEEVTTPVRANKVSTDYHPELYELLVRQYKHLSKNKPSGVLTPENMSPRFFNNRSEQFKPNTPLRISRKVGTSNQEITKKDLETSISNKNRLLIRTGKIRVHSLKIIKRLKQKKKN